MFRYFAKGNEWLGKRMFFVVLSALLLGFTIVLPESTHSASISIGLFAYMTFITALGTSFKDFIRVLSKPWTAIWMLILVHVAMPILAWGIGNLFTSKLALFLVVFFNASAVAPEILWSVSLLKMLLIILMLVTCGYGLGYVGSLLLNHRRRATVVTMVYNVGMRNISFGSVLTMAYFPASVAIPITLAMIFQQPMAAAVSYLFNRFDRVQALGSSERHGPWIESSVQFITIMNSAYLQ